MYRLNSFLYGPPPTPTDAPQTPNPPPSRFCIDCGWVKDDGRGQTAPQVTCGCLRGKGHAFPDKPQSGRGDAPSEFEKGVAEVLRRVKAGEEVPRALRSSRSGGGRKRPRVEREEEEGGCGEG